MLLDEGVYAATLTPLHQDLTIDKEELLHHCKDLLSKGVKGLVLFGTTGEGISFTTHERIDTIHYLTHHGIDPDKILVTNVSASIFDTVEFSLFVKKAKLKALLISPPSYYKGLSNQGIIDYYKEILTRIDDLPILLYHIPDYTGAFLHPSTIKTLKEAFPKTIIGIKDSGRSTSFTQELVSTFPSLQIFSGDPTEVKTAGTISGLASIYPELFVAAYKHRDPTLIRNLTSLKAHWEGLNFISAFKAVMEQRRGAAWSRLRPPLEPLTPEQKTQLGRLS